MQKILLLVQSHSLLAKSWLRFWSHSLLQTDFSSDNMQYLNCKIFIGGRFRSLDQTHSYCGYNLVEILLQVQNLHFAPEILLQVFLEFYRRPKLRSSPKFEGIFSLKSYKDQKRSSQQFSTAFGWKLALTVTFLSNRSVEISLGGTHPPTSLPYNLSTDYMDRIQNELKNTAGLISCIFQIRMQNC